MKVPDHKVQRQAIVIGGGMAGLLVARVLSDYFTHVSLIERDTYPADPAFRPGVPQGRHGHVLLVRGQELLETFFPGFRTRILAQGAVLGDLLADNAIRYSSGWLPRVPSSFSAYACTRTLLEWQIRQDLLRTTDVQIIEGWEVMALHTQRKSGAITGVEMRKRYRGGQTHDEPVQVLAADLVIDASGRDSRIMQWLEALGYEPPQETMVNGFVSYASRFYAPPPNRERTWQSMIMGTDVPKTLRSGGILAVEGGRWLVMLVGRGKEYPPTDEDGFLAFARGMTDPALYEALKDAQPLSPAYSYRKNGSRLRHFESLQRQPEGLLVVGDAVCSLNPIYAQGLTLAALSALTLFNCLAQTHGKLAGLAHRFQRQLARVNQTSWRMATSSDYSMLPPQEQPQAWQIRLFNAYLKGITASLPFSAFTCKTFIAVANLAKPPIALLHPAIVATVLTCNGRQLGEKYLSFARRQILNERNGL